MNLKKPLNLAVLISIIGPLAYFAVIAYLGSFSRYVADDYCEAVRVNSSSPFSAVIERYSVGTWRSANRYSNILFVGFSERLGENNLQVTITGMIVLWFAGLVWGAREFRKFLKINWSFQTDLFLGLALGFFSMLEAPNLFQTVFWRSSMMTHFAPLVFGSFLFAFFMRQARLSETRSPSWFAYLFLFFATFVIAGFSEPPTATMLTALPLLMLAAWFFAGPSFKQKYLALLGASLAGALLGLVVMLLSPASATVAQEKTLNIFTLLGNSFFFSYLFIVDTLRTLPLPTILSMLIPLLLVWLHRQENSLELTQSQKRAIPFAILLLPILVWLLIAAGFSPSVYGQGFPVERMRFLARSLIIAAAMLEGALFGLSLSRLRVKTNPGLWQWVVAALLTALAVIYPLRAAVNMYSANASEYRHRAELWDLRNAYILRHAALAEKEVVIPSFSGVFHVKEIDNNPEHWVNVCAANYYGVESIRARTIFEEDILEYLSE